MLKGFSAVTTWLYQHRLLAGTIVVSALLHSLLFWPVAPHPAEPLPEPIPVILAELRSVTPQQTQQQDAPAVAANTRPSAQPQIPAQPRPAHTQTGPSPVTSARPEPITPKPAASAPAATTAAATAQAGLSFSQEQLAEDPLERRYEQVLLAHLRQRLRAPAQWHGSVRLEIHFSYRQIATEIRVLTSSGQPGFDDWAQKAVMAANPFPPLPAELPDDFVFRPTIKTAD